MVAIVLAVSAAPPAGASALDARGPDAGVFAAASKRPPGAVKLTKALQKSVRKVRCGKIRGSWLPGTKLSGGYFISHTQQAANYKKLAARAKGKTRTKYLKTATSFKKKATSELKSCRVATPTPTPTPTPIISTSIRFATKAAVGVIVGPGRLAGAARAKPSAAHSSEMVAGSNASALLPSGKTQDLVEQGQARIAGTYASPDGKIFVFFEIGTNLGDPAPVESIAGRPGNDSFNSKKWCLVALVDKESGIPTCVDSDSTHIQDIPRFTANGDMYYQTWQTQVGGDGTVDILVKKTSGDKAVDVTGGSVRSNDLRDWIVLNDGSVIFRGISPQGAGDGSSWKSWLKRVSPTGAVTTILEEPRQWPRSLLAQFPDGNVYFGYADGIRRFLVQSGEEDSLFWLSRWRVEEREHNEFVEVPTAHFNLRSYCQGALNDGNRPYPAPSSPARPYGLCITPYDVQGPFITTTNNEVFAIAGQSGYHDPADPVRYYPTVQVLDTRVVFPSLLVDAGAQILIAGKDITNSRTVTLYDPLTGFESPITGAGDLEFHRMDAMAGDRRVMFDATRMSDGKPVIGVIDLATLEVSNVSETTAAVSGIMGMP